MRRVRAVALVRWLIVLVLIGAIGFVGTRLVLHYIRPVVTVTTVVEGPLVQAFYATGTLLPEREYPIRSNAPGYLTQVLVDKGDVVQKDQPLAIVTEDSAQQRFDQAKADRDLKQKLADEKTSPLLKEFDDRISGTTQLLEIARREQNRISEALARGASSQSDLDRALDRVKTLSTELDGLRAQRAARKLELERDLQVADAALKISQWNLDRQTIRSPIDRASILDRPLPIGTRLAVNDRIMQLADVRPESLVMRASVDEEDLTKVRSAQAVHMSLYAFSNRTFEGKVKKIYDKADPERRTFEVDVAMAEKDPAFAAGMTAELAFVMARKDQTNVVPSQAVQSGAIWVVRDGRLAKSDAVIGLRSVERTEILSGLKAGDQVVISPLDKPTPGQRVRMERIDPVAAAGLNKPKQEENPFRGFN